MKLYSWGQGKHGQLGQGDFKDLAKPKVIDSICFPVRQLLAVGNSSAVLDELNSLYTFG
jgi:alpha-tubulin suppressor-like RCC1 family protein